MSGKAWRTCTGIGKIYVPVSIWNGVEKREGSDSTFLQERDEMSDVGKEKGQKLGKKNRLIMVTKVTL